MSLLMPDYERQLKDAAKRLAPAGERPSSRGRSLTSVLLVGVSAAVAVAIAALVLVHGSKRTAGQSLPAVQYDCGAAKAVESTGPLVPVAHGTVAGMTWLLEADSQRHGVLSVQAGQLLIDDHAYGFCRTNLNVQLIDADPQGVVYGLLAPPFRAPLQIEGFPKPRTPGHAIRAKNAQIKATHVRGALLYVGSLPGSACGYQNVAITATREPRQSELGASGRFVGTCRPGQLLQTDTQPRR